MYLYCYNNALTTLDVSNNTALTVLSCDYNKLTELDVSNNIALTLLQCYGNPGSGGVFEVKAWFDDTTVPSGSFTTNPWKYNGSTVTIHYQKK